MNYNYNKKNITIYNNNYYNQNNDLKDITDSIDSTDSYDIIEKIIIPTKNYYCSNCNKRGHTYRKCNEPIISNGIIGFFIEDFNKSLLPILEDYILKNFSKKNKFHLDKDFSNILNSKIKFLMIQRKHSLGYLEFMRGRYELNNIESINFLLEQMTPNELVDLSTNSFDHLWNMLWDNIDNSNTNTQTDLVKLSSGVKNKFHYKEYILSKQKFYEIKLRNPTIFDKIKPIYNENEWGFPKGRRELYETDVVCAMREFEEETNYNEEDYTILDEKNNIKENLVGTNGIYYKHNYFLALIHDENINVDDANKEVGDIKIMDINTCLELIRPYHHNKIIILKKIHNLISNFILEYSNLIEELSI